jgi:hypothetical protein
VFCTENLDPYDAVVIIEVDVDAELIVKGQRFAMFDPNYVPVNDIELARRLNVHIGGVRGFVVRPLLNRDFAQLIDHVSAADLNERSGEIVHHFGQRFNELHCCLTTKLSGLATRHLRAAEHAIFCEDSAAMMVS